MRRIDSRPPTPRWWLVPTTVAVGLALWQTAPAWGPGPVAGDDTMAQLVRNEFGLVLLADGRTDGWFPRFMLGHQLFLFFGPGFTLALGALKLASFGLLSTAGAYKAAGIVGVAALGPSALFLGRSLGLRRAEAAAGAVLVLAVNSPFGLGLHGTYVIGLVPHQIAASLFCVALGSLVRMVFDDRKRWVAIGSIALAAVAITHPITALVLGVFLALALLTALAQRIGFRAIARVAATGLLAVGLTGFWAVPFLAHRDLQGPVTAWATPPLPERAAELARGAILWPAAISIAAVAGAAVCAVLAMVQGRRWFAFLALGPSAYLVVAHVVAARVEGAVGLSLANRGLGHAGVLAMLAAGAAVGTVARQTARRGPERRAARRVPRTPRRAWRLRTPAEASPPGQAQSEDGDRWATILVATAVAAAMTVVATAGARSVVGVGHLAGGDLRAVAGVLAALVPPSGRFATERDFPGEITRTGTVHPDLWLAAASGRNTLNLFNPESSPTDAGFAAEDIGRSSPTVVAATLARHGVTHVVTVREDTAVAFDTSERWVRVASHGELGVFAVRPPPGHPPPESLVAQVSPLAQLDARILRWTPEEMTIEVVAPTRTEATVALSWSPRWKADISGDPARLSPNADGIVTVAIPEGRHRLNLRFGPDAWDRVGLALSAMTLAGGGIYSVSLMSRRRSRTA